MRQFNNIFEAYGGDYETTMARFLGSEAMYLKLLNMLFRDDSREKLGAALEAGDLAGAFEAAHTLKGVAANLGLTPLCSAVSAIVEPLRAGDDTADYPALFEAIRGEFQRAEVLRDELGEGERT